MEVCWNPHQLTDTLGMEHKDCFKDPRGSRKKRNITCPINTHCTAKVQGHLSFVAFLTWNRRKSYGSLVFVDDMQGKAVKLLVPAPFSAIRCKILCKRR